MAEQHKAPSQVQEPRLPKRILVVDDDRAITTLFTTILEQHGYETAAAYSGEESVQVARSFQPDFILSDVVMGELNGVDAALAIRQFLPQCRMLFISGAGYVEPLETARARGFDFELLHKPVPARKLLEAVSRLLESGVQNKNRDNCLPAAS